jgi:predicted amidohydrolase YtcJ
VTRDAHTHLAAGAADLLDLDLREVRDPEAMATAIRRACLSAAPSHFIRGWGWDGVIEPADVAPRHSVFLARRDGHAAWVNNAARALLGLDPKAAVVTEKAFDAARLLIPARSLAERMTALRPRLSELSRLGIDAVDDMVEAWAPEVYARLRDGGELPIAIGMWLPEDLAESDAEKIRREFPADDPRVATRGIKIFLDGTLGARTAALSFPYADDASTSGELRIASNEIPERVARWASRGWPVALHAIGDRAVTLALDALERVPRPSAGAHRIEHAQVVLRLDLPRFARSGVVASVQPGHWRDDRTWLAARLGDRPEVLVHPLASFARAGVTMVFGSDWPVSNWNPSEILASATDPDRGDEALDAGGAASWYTSGRDARANL